MMNVVGIDVAVAQATQTPQQLQKQQAALYGGMGAMYMPTQSGAILDSILASGQPNISIVSIGNYITFKVEL